MRVAPVLMRGAVVVLILLILAPSLTCALSSPNQCSEGGAGDAIAVDGSMHVESVRGPIMIVMVCPGKPIESFALANVGAESYDLGGLWVSDGEGNLTFQGGQWLASGEMMAVCTDPIVFRALIPDVSVLPYSALIKKGSFVLANDGDSLRLYGTDGTLWDCFVYGDAVDAMGWNGPAFAPLPNGNMAVRSGSSVYRDSDQGTDWYRSVIGRTELEAYRCNAQVQPFLYPGQALGIILDRLDRAERSIDLAMYELEERAIVDALVLAERRGVETRILVEGQPVTGMSPHTKRALNDIWRGGGEIVLLRSNDSYKRYDYMHCKYAIIDQEYIIVGSENWVPNAFEGNRGWGAVLWSSAVADRLTSMFVNDSSLRFPDARMMTGPFDVGTGTDHASNYTFSNYAGWYQANLTVTVSPDNSLEIIRSLMGSGVERILIEQMQFDLGWARSSGFWDSLAEAGRNGRQVRLLLDAVLDDNPGGNRETVAKFSEMGEMGIDMEARLVSPFHDFSVVHNKGMVVDDCVLISSVNMVRGAFEENREIGVLIRSPELADWYAESFWEDWEIDPLPPVIDLPWFEYNCSEGESVFLDASNCWDNSAISSYGWDIGDDGVVDETGPRCLLQPGSGKNIVRLTIIDDHNNSASTLLVVNVSSETPSVKGDLTLYVPLLLAVAIPSLWFIRKRIKSH
jgi:phosphatidylserine/phosphatidylglycerophosphate/cardiolipin synthase-like enzyme